MANLSSNDCKMFQVMEKQNGDRVMNLKAVKELFFYNINMQTACPLSRSSETLSEEVMREGP